jgi:hypothetical protein
MPVSEYNAASGSVSMNVPTLILPYYQYGQRTILWDPANVWLKAWNAGNAETADAVQPAGDKNLIVPIGDLLDVSQMPDDKALTYDPQMLDQMMGRYSTDEAAILIAVPKDGVEPSLEISIYQARPTGPDYAQTLVIKGQPGDNIGSLYARGVDQARAIMRGNWKNKPQPVAIAPMPTPQTIVMPPQGHGAPLPNGPAQTYNGRVMFGTVQEWVRLKNSIERTPGIRSVIVKGLKPREAQITVTYAGDAVQLATAMQQAGVMMRSTTGQNAGYFPGSNGAQVFEFSGGAARY